MRKVALWSALALLAVANGTLLTFDNSVFTSLVRVFAWPAILLWLIVLICEKRFRSPHIFHYLFLAFFMWNTLSLLWTIDQDHTLDRLRLYFNYLLAIGVFWNSFRDKRQVEGAMQAFVVGSYITAGGTILSYVHGNAAATDSNRFSSFEFDPNDLGFIVALAAPIAWYLGHSARYLPKFWRIVNFLYPLAALAAILVTASRGALVASIPAVVYIIWTMRSYPLRWRIVVIFAAAIALFALGQTDMSKQINRLSTLGQSLTGGASGDLLDGRIQIWEAGWDVFTRNSFLGVGAGGFPIATLPYGLPEPAEGGIGIVAHNSYLSVLTETGVVGFLMFLAIILTLIVVIRKCEPSIRFAMYAALGVWLIGAGNLSFEYRWQTWLLFALVIAVAQSRRSETPAASFGVEPSCRIPTLFYKTGELS